MNVRSFSILYDLLCDSICGDKENTSESSVLVKVSALENGRLPVIAWEHKPTRGTTVCLCFPITQVTYVQGQDKECAARVNLQNLCRQRNQAVSGGLGKIEDQYYFYLLFDTAKPLENIESLYPELYRYMDQLALWLGIQWEQI